MLRTAGEH